MSDCFAPPETSTLVHCLHCREIYESYLIWFDERPGPEGPDGAEGFWTCPTAGCGGLGFTFDIWPIDPDYHNEETGERLYDEDEADIEDYTDEEWAEIEREDERAYLEWKKHHDANPAPPPADRPPPGGPAGSDWDDVPW